MCVSVCPHSERKTTRARSVHIYFMAGPLHALNCGEKVKCYRAMIRMATSVGLHVDTILISVCDSIDAGTIECCHRDKVTFWWVLITACCDLVGRRVAGGEGSFTAAGGVKPSDGSNATTTLFRN